MHGKQHGLGYFKPANSNEELVGEWKNGVRVRWLEKDSEQYKSLMENEMAGLKEEE